MLFFFFFLIHPTTVGAETSALTDFCLTLMLTWRAHIKWSKLIKQDFWHAETHWPHSDLLDVSCHFKEFLDCSGSRCIFWQCLSAVNKHYFILIHLNIKHSFTQTQVACLSLPEGCFCLIMQFTIKRYCCMYEQLTNTILFMNLLF